MPRPKRFEKWESEKKKVEDARLALQVKRDLLIDPETPPNVKAMVSEDMLNRIEGKPTNKTEISGPDGKPLQLQSIERRIVNPKN